MAQALGVRFLDAQGMSLNAGGGSLSRLASIDMQQCDPRLEACRIDVACDVDNPLLVRAALQEYSARRKGHA